MYRLQDELTFLSHRLRKIEPGASKSASGVSNWIQSVLVRGVILGPTHLRHTPSIQHQNPVIVRNLPVSAPSVQDHPHTVCRRCAIEIKVTSENSVWMILWISASVSGSTLDVASSSKSTLQPRTRARISDTVRQPRSSPIS